MTTRAALIVVAETAGPPAYIAHNSRRLARSLLELGGPRPETLLPDQICRVARELRVGWITLIHDQRLQVDRPLARVREHERRARSGGKAAMMSWEEILSPDE